MIELTNVSRWYGQVIGVNDVTTQIGPGITALLGMNGAGKSTMMKLITGQLRPTTGSVKVFGQEPFANPYVYQKLGYCPELDSFHEHMSGRAFVRYMAEMTGMSPKQAKDRAEEMLHFVGMTDRANRKIKGYSKGMRQRIKLAQAMVHDPEIILLDEPLNGLDPVGRHELMTVLEGLANNGKAIVVSSHILFEVEQMTRSIMLLHRGRLLARGDLRVIRELIDKHPHKIRIETPQPRLLTERLVHIANVVNVNFDPDGSVQFQVRQPDSFYAALNQVANEGDIVIQSVSSPDNNLESVFRYLVEA